MLILPASRDGMSRPWRRCWLRVSRLIVVATVLCPSLALAALSPGIKAIPPISTASTAASNLGVVSQPSDPSAPRYGSVHYQITLTSTTALAASTSKSVAVSIPAGITINPGPRVNPPTGLTTSCTPITVVVGPATITCTTTSAFSAGQTLVLANLSGVKTGTNSLSASVQVTAGDAACTVASPPASCSASNLVADSTPPGGMSCPATPLVAGGSFSTATAPASWYYANSPFDPPGIRGAYNYPTDPNTYQNSDATGGLFPIANPSDSNPISGIRSAVQESDGAISAVVYDFPNPLTAGTTYQFTADLSNRSPQSFFQDYYKISVYSVATNSIVATLFNGAADLLPRANNTTPDEGWTMLSDTFTVPTTGNYRLLFQINPNVDPQNSDYMIDRIAVCGQSTSRPLTLNKTTTGVVGGPFGFTLTNTTQTSGTVTTTVAGTATQVDGDTGTTGTQAYSIVSSGVSATINESTIPAGWSLTGAACTNAANATIGSLSGTTYTLTAAEIAATSAITCNFTNALLPADLSITKTNTPGTNNEADQANDTVVSGATVSYTIVVKNAGPGAAHGAVLADPATSQLTCTNATCSAAGSATCPTQTGAALVTALQGAGAVIPTLPNGGSVTVMLTCQVN